MVRNVRVCNLGHALVCGSIQLIFHGRGRGRLTRSYFEVEAVAVVSVAAVCVEEALSAQAVEGLARGYQLVPGDADTNVLLLAIDEGRGGHAGPVCLTLGASLLTLGRGAVTPQSCKQKETEFQYFVIAYEVVSGVDTSDIFHSSTV